MIRIILSSKTTQKPICYHTVTNMLEADRLSDTYSRIEGVKVEVLQHSNVT